MCFHYWNHIEDACSDRFMFVCRRCRAAVSLDFVGGVIHANLHLELGPMVPVADVEDLVASVLEQLRAPVVPRKHRRGVKRAA
jgi:hypothetical protein